MTERSTTPRAAVGNMVDTESPWSKVHELWSDLGPFKQASLCQILEEDTDLCHSVWQVLNAKRNDLVELDLHGDTVTQFMDLMNSKLLAQGKIICQIAFRLLVGLLQACDIAPSSIFISDVRLLENDAVFHGVYADIFKGFKDGQEVALKRPRIYIGDDHRRTQQALKREALIRRGLSHPNILPFLGIDSQTFPSNPCIVSPWMRYSTVLEHLKGRIPTNVEKFGLLLEVADGMAYLHRQNVVHGNLSGANILVDQNAHALLSGFSLAGFANTEDYDSELNALTSNYGADGSDANTEVTQARPRTLASDVYAFACVFLEIYAGQSDIVNYNYNDAERLRDIRRQRPSQPSDHGIQMSDDVWHLIRSCWHPDPSCRPTMDNILDQMKEIGFGTL
ncbi:hypothetical protein PILCRDRAFT_823036 [Piloderma croceum F 1598]|uniref:Protein kinase domain-containing protein n=1 Tax=Piloderma croceum (strain F 1598) TaxID=765440 RepID=A0A0C3FK15_PILCF|nr:hypothetical protein PILCRDRAFT_823036 [Piloderma croceum F 1598]